MTSISNVCNEIYHLIKAIGEAVWELDRNAALLEEARKVHRMLRRIEVFVSDIQPYAKGLVAWTCLREVEGVLTEVLQTLLEAGAKGPLVQYLQADRTLSRFSAAAAQLDASLATLQAKVCTGACCQANAPEPPCGRVSCDGPCASAASTTGFHLPAETREELACVRTLLQRTQFELPASHQANLQQFRQACVSLQTDFMALTKSYGEMMCHTSMDPFLSEELFRSVISELQQEVELQQQTLQTLQLSPRGVCRPTGRPGQEQRYFRQEQAAHCEVEQHNLRMLMDAMRAYHTNADCEAPLEFICPLTHQLMQEPVVLHETGHSYERKALEEWWAKGHRFCPRTGIHLKRLSTSPNHNLRIAIERWHLHSNMQLSFRPLLNTLCAQQRQQELGAAPCLLPAAMLRQDLQAEVPVAAGRLDHAPAGDSGAVAHAAVLSELSSRPHSPMATQQAGGACTSKPEPTSCCGPSSCQPGVPCSQHPESSRGLDEPGTRQAPTSSPGSQRALLQLPLMHAVSSEELSTAACTELDCACSSGTMSESTGRLSPAIGTPQRSTSKELAALEAVPCCPDSRTAAGLAQALGRHDWPWAQGKVVQAAAMVN